MMMIRSTEGYSSTIRGWLLAGGQRLELAQVGPDFLFLRTATTLPPIDGELVIEVDGDGRSLPIHLPDGVPETTGTRITYSHR